jgi:hypothetical protein
MLHSLFSGGGDRIILPAEVGPAIQATNGRQRLQRAFSISRTGAR